MMSRKEIHKEILNFNTKNGFYPARIFMTIDQYESLLNDIPLWFGAPETFKGVQIHIGDKLEARAEEIPGFVLK